MTLIIIVLFIFILLIVLTLKVKPERGSKTTEHPYKRLDVLFTPAERSFFGVLNQSIRSDVVAFGKVRVADVITPEKGGEKGSWQRAFNKISAKHFDFVLCNKGDLSFICAIELDDKSHNNAKQKARDAFLESACKSANLPLIRIPAKATYRVNDLQELLSGCFPETLRKDALLANAVPETELKSNAEPAPAPVAASEPEPEKNKKYCPKCSSEMRIKVAKKGKSVGKKFWACSGFPKCRYIEKLDA